MKNQKTRGAYYTPIYLSDFILKHVFPSMDGLDKIDILEPSVGDGIFIDSLISSYNNSSKQISFTAIEKYIDELRKAELKSKSTNNISFRFIHGDFLNIQEFLTTKFQLVIGNPPYIRKNRLNKSERNKCSSIHTSAGLSEKSVKNIWSVFLIRCIQMLEVNGTLAFVLPSDLLQAKFSNEIRDFLIKQFERIEIFTFHELLFKDIGQDIILLFCFKNSKDKGVFYSHIKNIEALVNDDYQLNKNDSLTSSGTKWTHHFLSKEEISFLLSMRSRLNVIDDYCESKPGIVTAANSYFIINSKLEKEYNLGKYSRHIIQKGSYVNGKVVFDKTDLRILDSENKPTKILCFSVDDFNYFDKKNKEYLTIGKDMGIINRYKCSLRKIWYIIPNIGKPPDGFFFKRCNRYPKVLLNKANVLVTDSAYKIEMKENYGIKSLIYSFYNSLTLAFAELEGRYYGDGVLELTPKEFKNLPLPFINVRDDDFRNFENCFSKKMDIEEIFKIYDEKILGNTLNISASDIDKIRMIRKKLVQKRMRVN